VSFTDLHIGILGEFAEASGKGTEFLERDRGWLFFRRTGTENWAGRHGPAKPFTDQHGVLYRSIRDCAQRTGAKIANIHAILKREPGAWSTHGLRFTYADACAHADAGA